MSSTVKEFQEKEPENIAESGIVLLLQRTKLRKAGKIEEANHLEQEYLAKLEAREEQRLATRLKKKKKK